MRLKQAAAVIVSLLVAISSASFAARAQVGKLLPVDEAAQDPAFFVFRARLLEAVSKKDSSYLLTVVSPSIQNGFGGDNGIAEFRKGWKPERADSELWPTLARILSQGGSFQDKDTFAAPYYFSRFPEKYDAFEHGVIVGENVRVRQQPSTDGQIVASLSFDVIKVNDWAARKSGTQNWIQVELTGGGRGYVAEDFIRSPIGYRAIFTRKGGRWELTALVSGD